MKILSLTVENVYWLSQLISIVLLGGTVVCGGVVLFTGKISNDRTQKELETERIKRLELEAKVAPRRLTGRAKKCALDLSERGSFRSHYRVRFLGCGRL